MVDMFIYRDPDEVEKEEKAESDDRADVRETEEWPGPVWDGSSTPPPGFSGVEEWGSEASSAPAAAAGEGAWDSSVPTWDATAAAATE